MIQTWQVIALVLLAVLVGAAVPALLQLRRTLRSAESVLNGTGPRIDRALDEVTEAARRINRVGDSLEQNAEGLKVLCDAAAGLGRTLRQAQESLHLVTAAGAAFGPAIVAGLRALFARDDHASAAPSGHAAAEPPGRDVGKEASAGHE